MSNNCPKISLVICTYNRSDYLQKCINSLRNQDISLFSYEIIVIDNNSSDNTSQICHKFLSISNFKYFFEPNQGLSHARNRGIKESVSPIIAYIDDDAIASPKWASQFISAFEDPEVGAAGGPILPDFECVPPKWFHNSLLPLYSCRVFAEKICDLEPQKFFFGGNAAYRKEVLLKAGGFRVDLGRKGNDLLSDEELALFKLIDKYGYKKRYRPDAIIYHSIPQSRMKRIWLLRRSYWLGKGNAFRGRENARTIFYNFILFRNILTSTIKDLISPRYDVGIFSRLMPIMIFFGYLRVFIMRRPR